MKRAPLARQRQLAVPAHGAPGGESVAVGQLRWVQDAIGREGLELRYLSFGVRVGVWFDAGVLEYAEPADLLAPLPPGWEPAGAGATDVGFRVEYRDRETSPIGAPGFHLYESRSFVAFGAVQNRLDHLLAVLENRLHASVAARSPHYLFLHAGVVGWLDRAIVLPGASLSGKSTLVRYLVDAGATYFSDEFAVIDQSGMVHPFPRRLTARIGSTPSAYRIDLRARAPLGAPESAGMPIGLVALTRYEPGTGWRVAQLDAASAVLALSEHALSLDRDPARCLGILNKVVSASPVLLGARGEAAEAAESLLREIGRLGSRDSRQAGAWRAA